uniref:Uncharacterized protein n=1 Tax=Magallana gigas TaxID=29159 RepID=K1QQA1_MAGGI
MSLTVWIRRMFIHLQTSITTVSMVVSRKSFVGINHTVRSPATRKVFSFGFIKYCTLLIFLEKGECLTNA